MNNKTNHHELDCGNLSSHASSDESFTFAYIRVITSIASTDGVVSLAEFQALNDIITNSGSSAVTAACFLQLLERPVPLKVALAGLKAASQSTDEEVRHGAFGATQELLKLQGSKGLSLAKDLAESLVLPQLAKSELTELDTSSELTVMQRLRRSTVGKFAGKDMRSLAAMCLSVSGDLNIDKKLKAYEAGVIPLDELRSYLTQTSQDVLTQLDEFEKTLAMAEFAESTASAFLETAEKLRNQVQQRLQLVRARIEFERETFDEDIDHIVHDAGNEFQIEVNERLATDKAKKVEVWNSIARSTFAKEIDRRLAKTIGRREELLRLLKEDLRLFQEEMRITSVSIHKQQHFSKYAPLMPKLRMATRVKNAVDTAADTTLKVGVVAIATSVVLPVIAPALPLVAGAMAVAGLIKLIADPGARVRAEILDKRKAFQEVLRGKLIEAQKSFNTQLDEVAAQFNQSALLMIKPIMLEAEAADKLASLQVKVARKLVTQSKSVIAKIGATSLD